MEKVGIVILNYLNYQDTIDCIDSLNIDLYNNKEIIIVDNYSKNESYNILNDLYKNNKHIHVIKNDCNSGFAKGNNIGIEYAKNVLDCSHVLLLNSDTVIKCNDFIKSFVESYESGVGIIGCRIVTLEGIEQNPHRLNIHKNDIVDKLYKLKNDKLSIREKAYSIKSYKILEEFILRRSRIKRNKDKVKNNIT